MQQFIRFTLCNPSQEADLKTKENLQDNMKSLLKTTITKLQQPANWKYLDRCEPAISSLDEKKQLRLRPNWTPQKKTEDYYIFFDDLYGEERLTRNEMEQLGRYLKVIVEDHLGYGIFGSICREEDLDE